MATHHGKSGVVKVGANSVAEVTQFSITETAETADDSAMGDGARTHKTGLTSATGNITCHWDPSDTNGQQALTVGASVTLNLYPGGADSGDAEISCTATVTSVSPSAQLDGIVSRSFDFQANGAVTHGTVV